ncbi:cytochrome c biogenesis protein CcdC [Paenibacillus thermotolerans]|uniref:cytochrome c biogenesis protein CcdC n=1 Tax=Paenibacillus thermotolerans TaxID=3027807 RepID=UPI0023688156|nr:MULTISPECIES: cytochrome c biogenesis protein CcdC [unclassified Paenibacillus]
MGASFYGIALAVAALIMYRRTKNMYRPIKGDGRRILIPIFFIAIPGAALVTNPEAHALIWEWFAALLLGVLLSIPLIWTTDYEIREDRQIYAKKNMWFVIAFVIVIAIRFLLRNELNMFDQQTKAALFMMVAAGYIIPWRVVSFIKFRKTLQHRELAIAQP